MNPHTGDAVDTLLGVVQPWECDATGHFTVTRYLVHLEAAIAALLGTDATPASVTRCLQLRFHRELLAGDPFRIDSAVLGSVARGGQLGQRLLDAAGQLCTSVVWQLRPAAAPAPTGHARNVAWPDCAPVLVPAPAPDLHWTTGCIERLGSVDLGALGHCFTAASTALCTRLGMDRAHRAAVGGGLSTFELHLEVERLPTAGDTVRVETALAAAGRSSLTLEHRLRTTAGAPGCPPRTCVRLRQRAVHLDLRRHRPLAMPASMRERAAALLPGTGAGT